MANNKNGELTTYDKKELAAVRKAITDKHKLVSSLTTPSPYIKKKQGMDYVEYSYMREVADKQFPGWSWTIEKTEVLGSEAYVVHGRLKWFDEGIWRQGDMCAAHRIQKKRGIDEFVDIGNDVKAANTDCIKKAFNMYMNICDDVYRNQVEDFELSDEQKDEIVEAAALVSESRLHEITELLKDQVIHNGNYKSSLAKLNREAK
jgi:uncharacterized membrane-anchored protein YjiN (DUF445 family)